ncbi:MAG: DNA polymerase III subunit alpha [Roseovarius sp.]|nr:DNA polymerase III subunit alpha [Roseovarius sp.]
MSGRPEFIHLRLHTEYSVLEGAVRLKELPDMCLEDGMPAVAVTDTNNMFSALEFSVGAIKKGIQPILGCQADMVPEGYDQQDVIKRGAPLVLLAQNERGYENLIRLNSGMYLNEGRQLPHLTLDELEANSESVICLTGGADGPVGRLIGEGHHQKARKLAYSLAKIFGNRIYIELQRHPGTGDIPDMERMTERFFIEMAYEMDLPLVATNDVYFSHSNMFDAHDAMICVAEGVYLNQEEARRHLTQYHYFTKQREMAELFADLPEALENTVEIARRCAFSAPTRDPILPKFASNEVEELRCQARAGLKQRLNVISHAATPGEYEKRLEFELETIEQMGFPGYFLIVADFIKWAKENGIPVGPGRGSGAGSLVAYALTITDLDPLRYNLLFERFLNPERVSIPDFDIDFCMDRREEVIEYIKERYGEDKVAQIITFGGLLSKMVVRDIGRVLNMPYGQVDRIAKMIPVEGVKPLSIKEALKQESRLSEMADNEPQVKQLLDYGMRLEGLIRNASTHAAGVVIGDHRPLNRLVPLYRDVKSDMPATQFNMKWVEQAGLVKYDLLGLKTLTAIQYAIDFIREQNRDLHVSADGHLIYEPKTGAENQINAIPLDDEKTFRLYADARTVAVFQVEGSGMMDALKRMKPTCIEDIVAIVALYRPGPMENIPQYCEVKNRIREREFMHPLVDHILDETQGIIVYQEQVMQIAQEMAGYTLGGADLLRRAMGKKIKEAMDAERPKFIKGAKANGVSEKKATEVWELLEKFANYGFNKSHAAAYAVVSYQTAWLKANHPSEFMAGVMNCDLHNADKLGVYFNEVANGLKLKWHPPCVNNSKGFFSVKNGVLNYALAGLKNVGLDAMINIEKARGESSFVTVFDFARRVDMKRISKRALEMMARAGAFDILDGNRRRILESIDALCQYSGAVHRQRESNQESLFGESGDDLPEPRLAQVDDWNHVEKLREEYRAVGFYLSGHPLEEHETALKRMDVKTIGEVAELTRSGNLQKCQMAGVVASIQERKSSQGKRFAFIQLSDQSGGYEVTMFSEALENSRDLLEVGKLVVLDGEVNAEAGQLKILVRSLKSVESVVQRAGNIGLRVFIDSAGAVGSVAQLLESFGPDMKDGAKGPLHFSVTDAETPGEVEIDTGRTLPVGKSIRGAIKSLEGVVAVEEF